MTLLDELKKDTNEPWTKEHPEIKSIVSKIFTANRNGKHELIVNGELLYLKKLNRYFSSEGFDCLISEKEYSFLGMINRGTGERVGCDRYKCTELRISW